MISIITPTYNSGAYLERCIQSIVNQEFDDYEHIIVDGGSTDNTLAIIKKYESLYNIKWISEKDNGMYDAISKGFKMAEGDILCWLNSDDIYMPWTLKVVEHVFQNTDIDWCTGVPTQINENGEMYFPIKTFVTYPQFCIRKGWMDGQRLCCIQQESTFWRKSLYDHVDGIDTDYKLAGDYALWVKFSNRTKLHTVNSVLAGFRVHEGQKSENRLAYCNEAHRLTGVEKIINKLKIYKIINRILKEKEQVIDIRTLE